VARARGAVVESVVKTHVIELICNGYQEAT
jgi:hypothetical protein